MAKINTLNYQTVASWNGSQDLFVVEQTDGTKVATPAQLKQYVLGNSIDDIYSVMGQNGAKNLVPYPYYESDHTESGITWTVNSDGSVTANGTATANSTFIFRQRTEQTKIVEKNTSYILSGCPSGGSNSKYMLYLFVQTQEPTNITSGTDYGNGATINMPDQDYYGIYMFARVISGQTVSNLTFKPMLRLASDTDDTYQPYAKTNKELTEVIGDLSQTGLTGDSVAEQLTTAKGQIGDLSQTTVTGDTVAAQLKSIKNVITFDKVPDSFITLQSGISIVTNQVYKQGNHIFGWITFGFSVQTPSALKLGVLNSGYRPSGISRMMVGLGTQPWSSEYVGYCLRDSDYSFSVTGSNNVRAAHIHLDYVV